MIETVSPKVSVLIVTYNHERFLGEAIESVLMQECRSPYEIIIADDCSTDATLAIAATYAGKYPERIFVHRAATNQGITRNYRRSFPLCRGEYVAVLEGDDYWTSPFRLTRHVEFLHAHRECALCFNRFFRYYEDSGRSILHPPFESSRTYELFTTEQLVKDNFIGNFSACTYRRSAVEALDASLYELTVYDWMFNMAISQNGLIGYLPEVMSVYRKHSAGTSAGKTLVDRNQQLLDLIDDYDRFFGRKFEEGFRHERARILRAMKTQPSPQPSRLVGFAEALAQRGAAFLAEMLLPPIVLRTLKHRWHRLKSLESP